MALSDILVNDEKLQTEVAAMIDRAQKAIDVELQQASLILGQQVTAAATQIGNVISGSLISAQNTGDHLIAQAAQLLAAQDGWTLKITIPPIEIQLRKPEPK